jgi:hypothetical protein
MYFARQITFSFVSESGQSLSSEFPEVFVLKARNNYKET